MASDIDVKSASFTAEITNDSDLDTPVIRLKNQARDTKYRTEVAITPEFGSNLISFKAGGHDIMYCDKAALKNHQWTGCFVMWPIPNRLRGREYDFEGTHYSLKDFKRDHDSKVIVHGLVDNSEWSHDNLISSEEYASVETSISILPESPMFKFYPFESTLKLKYLLNNRGIKIQYTVENLGKKLLPFGFGLHPYFTCLSGKNGTQVKLPAQYIMQADEELLPSGTLHDVTKGIMYTMYDLRSPRPVGTLNLDHVYTGLSKDDAYIDYTEQRMRIHLNASEDFTHMILYTPPQEPFFCFENQTCSTDFLNLHTRALKEGNEELLKSAHLLTVKPGESHTGFIEYEVEHY